MSKTVSKTASKESLMLDAAARRPLIDQIAALPDQVAALVAGLTAEQVHSHFLPGEWTVAQNVHHLADSHMNSFVRTKLLLSEDHPAIRPYDQDRWAALPDGDAPDLEASLLLLAGLHRRWVHLFESLDEQQWARTGMHPESGVISVVGLLESYAAHGEGHLDQMRRTLAAQR